MTSSPSPSSSPKPPKPTKTRRAEPLTPNERRLAVIEAVAPLLVDHGATVTTRQMAEAAGIAEGTLFSVFPDKRSVILATIEHRMDPTPLLEALSAASVHASLEEQLIDAATYILRCVGEMGALANVLHTLPRSETDDRPHAPPSFMKAWSAAATEGIAALLQPYQTRLRLPPVRIARVLLGLLFATRWAEADADRNLSTREVVDVFLHGVVSLQDAETEEGE